jgi:hypothetical protein
MPPEIAFDVLSNDIGITHILPSMPSKAGKVGARTMYKPLWQVHPILLLSTLCDNRVSFAPGVEDHLTSNMDPPPFYREQSSRV